MRARLQSITRAARWMLPLVFSGPGATRTTADLIERRVAAQPDAVFVRFEGQELRYGEYNAAANRVAHWALAEGLGRGDVVGLLMQNRPRYLETWAGLAKAGVTTALLNTQLSSRGLAHAIAAAGTRTLIVGEECLQAWSQPGNASPRDLDVYVATDPGLAQPAQRLVGARSFDEATADRSTANPPRQVRSGLRGGDALFYIYTSGTTGLPKAARFSHARFAGGGIYALLAGFGRNDTFYCPLPLYHTVGGVMCVNAVLRAGGTLALARRFSSSRFWEEIVEMGATAFQYIGELPRYLLERPEHPLEHGHQIRFCVGNGLRPEVWRAFSERFGIPHIVEFYGATESNISMVNLDDRVGSVGKPAPGMTAALVRYDVAHETHLRDASGNLVRCRTGEVGELIGKITEGRTAAGRFEGYASKESSEKKILRDAFHKGDAWFRTGDLMRRDAQGYYYFVDRIGDTFRWKGENVSTQEVADALSEVANVELGVVYGVPLPQADGCVGMAALVLHEGVGFDGAALYAHAARTLPAFARPAFVRLIETPDVTGTFKIRKRALQEQGFDPKQVSDPIFYRDDGRSAFLPLTAEVHERIRDGAIRF